MSIDVRRCPWAKSEPNIQYHDREWGVPVHDDRTLFEFLVLEGAQAGLSWETVLKKRENYRVAFDQFDPHIIIEYGPQKQASLLSDPGIIRNRLKVASVIQNARMLMKVQEEFETFDEYIWRFVGGKAKTNTWRSMDQVPSRTDESDAMSKDLQKRGFKFVGSTICYAFMQATGMVNDHLVSCFRHAEVSGKRR